MTTMRITLTVVHGALPQKEYVFEQSTRCSIGRSEDCDIPVPADGLHADISRRHCCLEVEPPTIRVRDLGSRNGTWINGHKIGQRARHQLPQEADLRHFATHELQDGDELQVGSTILRVSIVSADFAHPTGTEGLRDARAGCVNPITSNSV
jgi:pSer/pThr/pTyr-binding forkhead associated (FHA) protein